MKNELEWKGLSGRGQGGSGNMYKNTARKPVTSCAKNNRK